MAQPSFDQFMYGIGYQETRGNKNAYGEVNSYGAVGKYQVLKSNIPEWSRRVLGHSITWQEYRDSPKLQEQIVRGILKGYYDQWGARGAAAAWYAGPGSHGLDQSTRPQSGGPSIKSYVDGVIGYAGGSPNEPSTYSGSGIGGDPVVPKISWSELKSKYGFTSDFLNANPDIKNLFSEMVSGDLSQSAFDAKLKNTNWWKTHSQREKEYLVQMYNDPATAQQARDQAATHVKQLAAQLGIQLTPENKKRLSAWTYNVAAKGWSDDQLRYDMGRFVGSVDGVWSGEAEAHREKLHEYAYSMGVNLDGGWYANATRKIVSGTGTEQDYTAQILQKAKAAFPQYSKQLDGGQTLADIASPYMQSMSQVLELPAGSINLFDPTIKKALQYKDPNSLKTESKPLWQFENELRDDPRWRQTKNAQDSLFQIGHQVLADFGFKS